MACYHCSVRILSRSAGRSSVQFSAYISAAEMKDERLGKTFSHTSKEEVCFTDMLFADRLPSEIRNPENFWNEIEKIEKQSNAQVARTFEIALPHELSIEQNVNLTKEFAESLMKDDGIPAVQYAIHNKSGNVHAHLMVPTRDYQTGKWQPKEKKGYALDENGNKIPVLDENGNQKFRERKGKGREMLWERATVAVNPWNSKSMLKKWRKRVADLQNTALEKYGYEIRVDHRSYTDQNVDKIPTIHEGYEARKIEIQGRVSERCEYNRNVIAENARLQKIANELKKLMDELVRKEKDLNGRIAAVIKRRTTSRNAGTGTDGKRGSEIREREVKIITEDNGTVNNNDNTAARTDSIITATADIAAAKQREADLLDAERKAAEQREREAEAERARTRAEAAAKREADEAAKAATSAKRKAAREIARRKRQRDEEYSL